MKHLNTTLINFQKITDPRGNLTVAQSFKDVPFAIERAYWVYDVPSGECRGGHSHKSCKEIVVALSGSFHVTLDNGDEHELMSILGVHLTTSLQGPFVLF